MTTPPPPTTKRTTLQKICELTSENTIGKHVCKIFKISSTYYYNHFRNTYPIQAPSICLGYKYNTAQLKGKMRCKTDIALAMTY